MERFLAVDMNGSTLRAGA
jgi:hypothetical protein